MIYLVCFVLVVFSVGFYLQAKKIQKLEGRLIREVKYLYGRIEDTKNEIEETKKKLSALGSVIKNLFREQEKPPARPETSFDTSITMKMGKAIHQ